MRKEPSVNDKFYRQFGKISVTKFTTLDLSYSSNNLIIHNAQSLDWYSADDRGKMFETGLTAIIDTWSSLRYAYGIAIYSLAE